MLDPKNIPDVGRQEKLSRFICSRSHFRPSDGTVTQNAFVPHPREALSVNRDLEASEDETWQVGVSISKQLGKSLYGKADALAATYFSQALIAKAEPIHGNPNHVDILGWPSDKSAQKVIAQEIAAIAKFVTTPEAISS